MNASRPSQPVPTVGRQRRPRRGVDAGAATRARVLVVDDDERNLLAIRTVIEDLAEVEVATSGEEALRHLLKGEFAVILLDVYMPGMDGYETAQIIRGREQTKRIPIVFLSAVNKEKEHLMRGYSMGAVDYVFKPVEPIVLRSKVAVFVDLFTMTQEIQRKAEQEQQLLDANLRANAERLRVEQELRLAEQRQAAIIESLPIVLYLEPLERDAALARTSSAAISPRVTGFDVRPTVARPADGLGATGSTPRIASACWRRSPTRERTGAMAIEYRWQCADGQYRHFLDQAVLLRGGDGDAGPICRHPARRHRPQGSREAAAPGPQDGRDRQADRRHRPRFQQSARRGARRASA